MKQNKNNMVGVKLNDTQIELLDQLIADGKCKTRSGGLQYLINEKLILSNKK